MIQKIAFCLLIISTMIVGYAPEKEFADKDRMHILAEQPKIQSTCPLCKHENTFNKFMFISQSTEVAEWTEAKGQVWDKQLFHSCRKCGVVYDVMVGRGEK